MRRSCRIKGLDLSFPTCSEKRLTLVSTLTKLVSRERLRPTGEYKKAVQELATYSLLTELELAPKNSKRKSLRDTNCYYTKYTYQLDKRDLFTWTFVSMSKWWLLIHLNVCPVFKWSNIISYSTLSGLAMEDLCLHNVFLFVYNYNCIIVSFFLICLDAGVYAYGVSIQIVFLNVELARYFSSILANS